MIADPEDLLLFIISISPFALLCMSLMGRNTKTHQRLLLISILLFIVMLPYTTLYTGLLLTHAIPWSASPDAETLATLVLIGALIICCCLLGMMAVRGACERGRQRLAAFRNSQSHK